MTDNAKKFLEKLSADKALAARVSTMDKDAVLAEAQRLGIALTEADLAPEANAELNENELNAVAGGGTCACVFVGGGTKSDTYDKCVCAFYGIGEFADEVERCGCVGAGGGVAE